MNADGPLAHKTPADGWPKRSTSAQKMRMDGTSSPEAFGGGGRDGPELAPTVGAEAYGLRSSCRSTYAEADSWSPNA